MAVQKIILKKEEVDKIDRNPVVFYNGRITNGERKPWVLTDGYTDQYGMTVSTKNCPLCELDSEGNLVQTEIIVRKGETAIATYGKAIGFNYTKPSINLNPITHYLLIKRLRNWKRTISSKKDLGKDSQGNPIVFKRKHGWLIEHEPNLILSKERKDAETKLKVFSALINVNSTSYRRDLIAQHFNVYDADQLILSGALSKLAEANPVEFLSIFNVSGSIDKGFKFQLKRDYLANCILRLSLRKGVISRDKNGFYRFGEEELGRELAQVPKLHGAIMPLIEAKIKEVYGIVPQVAKPEGIKQDA